jgi:hypothetical protein
MGFLLITIIYLYIHKTAAEIAPVLKIVMLFTIIPIPLLAQHKYQLLQFGYQ